MLKLLEPPKPEAQTARKIIAETSERMKKFSTLAIEKQTKLRPRLIRQIRNQVNIGEIDVWHVIQVKTALHLMERG